MINLTRPDAQWLERLLDITEYIQGEYPELFSEQDEEVMLVAGQLIRKINS